MRRFKKISRVIVFSGSASLLLSAWLLFLSALENYWAGMILSGPVLVAIILASWRFSASGAHQRTSRKRILLVGNRRDADIVSTALDSQDSPFRLVGFLSLERSAEFADSLSRAGAVGVEGTCGTNLADVKVLESAIESHVTSGPDFRETPSLQRATPERIREAALWNDVQSVVVRNDAVCQRLTSELAQMRFQGIRIYPLPDFYMKFNEELPLELLGDAWLSFSKGFNLLSSRMLRKVKRLMDFSLAGVGLLLSVPVLFVCAAAIKLDSRGPVFFRQWRVGRMGRSFQLLKLRTMSVEAEHDGKARWAAENDPRVTRVGRVLRKLRVDELPQLVNVLCGEMSFVGPRPERREFVDQLATRIPYYQLRHFVPPGVSGWAQVNYPYGASIQDARRKLQFDLFYIRNASPLLDLRILLRTVKVVLLCQGSR
jgi:exopolysaccharide biosynthesis polyprenyl glycosylphosphotransferase